MRKKLLIFLSIFMTALAVFYLPLSALPRIILTLSGIIGMVLFISFVTAVLELRCYLKAMGRIARPMVRFAHLSDFSAQAFLTSFASGSVAAMMLADGYKNGNISRREMILSALCNSVPPILMFNGYLTLPLIGIIGKVGGLYFVISSGISLLALCLFLVITRIGMRGHTTVLTKFVDNKVISWRETFRKAAKQTMKFLYRLLLLTTPFYLWTACALRNGWLDFSLPLSLQSFLSPEALSVIAARVGGLMAAAGTAAELLRGQQITTWQLLIALLLGNMLNGFTRLLRRGLPVSMGIYPGYDGVIIATTSTGVRIILTAIMVVILWRIQA